MSAMNQDASTLGIKKAYSWFLRISIGATFIIGGYFFSEHNDSITTILFTVIGLIFFVEVLFIGLIILYKHQKENKNISSEIYAQSLFVAVISKLFVQLYPALFLVILSLVASLSYFFLPFYFLPLVQLYALEKYFHKKISD